MGNLSPAAVLFDELGNPIGVALDGAVYRLQSATKIESWFGATTPTVGQKAMAASIPVTVSSDQSNVPLAFDNVVSTVNSTAAPLGIGLSFTGTSEEVKDYSTITVQVWADEDSATDGFVAEFSTDGANWDVSDSYTISANTGRAFTFYPSAQYFRVRYINNAVSAQLAFRLQTIYHRVRTKPSSISIAGNILEPEDAELVRSIQVGEEADGTFQNISTENGKLNVIVGASLEALPKMVNLTYDVSVGAHLAGAFRTVVEWDVPAGFNGYLIRFMSWQNETAISRLTTVKIMGSVDTSTNVFTPGDAYAAPQWAPYSSQGVEADVTSAIAGGPGTLTITATYTNEDGTPGRTGTFDVDRGAGVGERFEFTPQVGDLGVRSVENLVSDTLVAGGVRVLGHIQLVRHQDKSISSSLETVVGAGAMAFPSGTHMHLEFAGGAVSKARNLDALIQLVPE